MNIVFTGGGTGGHLFPLIAVRREVRRLYPKDDILFHYVGPKDQESFLLLSQEGFKIHVVAAGKIRRYFSFANITDVVFFIPLGFLQSFFKLLFIRPKLMFSKGGTGSLPVTFGAALLGIPVFLHESDVVPGLSNKITSTWAKKIFLSFEKTEYVNLSKAMVVGNPIRKELLEGTDQGAKESLHITFEKPVVLFYGGSQGAMKINEFVVGILHDILLRYEVIHVCGKKNYRQVMVESKALIDKNFEKYYHLYDALNEVQLKHAYKAAGVIVARAGSASIFEIAALGKPSILIPLPTAAGDHQSKNAYEYAKTKAAFIVEESSLTPHFFIGQIQHSISESNQMSQAALAFAKPLAAKAIAREILEYLTRYKI